MSERDPKKYLGRATSRLTVRGVFPLEVVVFPGSYIPLYIFEERYKKMVQDCIDKDEEFGINYTSGEKIYDFGCLVRVSEVTKIHKNGEMNIIVVGCERARLDDMLDGRAEYLMGNYECYVPEEKEFDVDLLEDVSELYNRIVSSVENPILQNIKYDDLNRLINPSYLIAQKAGLSIEERQEILSLAYENDRLEVIRKHLKGVIPLATKTDIIQKVIKNNGYIGPYTFGI